MQGSRAAQLLAHRALIQLAGSARVQPPLHPPSPAASAPHPTPPHPTPPHPPPSRLHTTTATAPRRSPITSVQLGGYAVAFLGVCWYNYQKIQQMKAAAQLRPGSGEAQKQQESKPLLGDGK